MSASAPHPYPAAIAALFPRAGSLDLGPGTPRPEELSLLKSLESDPRTWKTPPVDGEMANLCLAGLWLAHNYLDRSHRISQSVKTTSGSYWHGIMHRREGDYSNAKYWFRQVGTHPIFDELAATAFCLAEQYGMDGVSQSHWDPHEFIDCCQRAVPGSDRHAWCVAVAAAEWHGLFEYCYGVATGRPR